MATRSDTAAPAPVRGPAPLQDGVDTASMLRMAAGAALLSCTSIFVALAHVAPTVSAFYRMLLGGSILAVWAGLRGQWRPFARTELVLASLPALGFAADLLLWHRSILYVGPGLATLLTNLQVFLLALVGLVAYRERLGPRFLAGVLLAMAGLWLLVGAHWGLFDARHRAGVWLGLGSGVAYTVYLLSFRRALGGRSRLQPAAFLALMSLECALLLGLVALAEGDRLWATDAQSWLALAGLGVFGQVVAWLLMVGAMPRIPASLVGLMLLLQPALAFVLDVLLFGRVTDALDWLGFVLALGGIFLGSVRRPTRRPSASSRERPSNA